MPEITKAVVLLPSGRFYEVVYETIAGLLAERQIAVSRPEVEFSSGQRLGKACADIEASELVLADVSWRNPNTMYLAGYAQGVGKRVLFLTQHGEDFPFDRAKHEVLVYNGNAEVLREELGRVLSGAKEESKVAGDARSRFAELFGDILKAHNHVHRGAIEMEGEKTFVLLEQDMELPLVQDLARKAREMGMRVKLM